jgi:hypothetical protein
LRFARRATRTQQRMALTAVDDSPFVLTLIVHNELKLADSAAGEGDEPWTC